MWVHHHITAHPKPANGDKFQILRAVANILNKQLWTVDKG